MTLTVAGAMRAVLIADPQIVAALSTHDGDPAVFTGPRVPPTAEPPFVHVEPQRDVQDVRTLDGGSPPVSYVSHDIRLYAADTLSMVAILAAGERIRSLFGFRVLAVDGYARVTVQASGPIEFPADEDIAGCSVSVRVRLAR